MLDKTNRTLTAHSTPQTARISNCLFSFNHIAVPRPSPLPSAGLHWPGDLHGTPAPPKLRLNCASSISACLKLPCVSSLQPPSSRHHHHHRRMELVSLPSLGFQRQPRYIPPEKSPSGRWSGLQLLVDLQHHHHHHPSDRRSTDENQRRQEAGKDESNSRHDHGLRPTAHRYTNARPPQQPTLPLPCAAYPSIPSQTIHHQDHTTTGLALPEGICW